VSTPLTGKKKEKEEIQSDDLEGGRRKEETSAVPAR